MSNKLQFTVKRKPLVLDQFGIGKTTLHNRILDGLLPPPIPLGARSVGWLSHELDQVLAFMAAGKSDDEIRSLVAHLVSLRKELAA